MSFGWQVRFHRLVPEIVFFMMILRTHIDTHLASPRLWGKRIDNWQWAMAIAFALGLLRAYR
jgi:hypothetical protein